MPSLTMTSDAQSFPHRSVLTMRVVTPDMPASRQKIKHHWKVLLGVVAELNLTSIFASGGSALSFRQHPRSDSGVLFAESLTLKAGPCCPHFRYGPTGPTHVHCTVGPQNRVGLQTKLSTNWYPNTPIQNKRQAPKDLGNS